MCPNILISDFKGQCFAGNTKKMNFQNVKLNLKKRLCWHDTKDTQRRKKSRTVNLNVIIYLEF